MKSTLSITPHSPLRVSNITSLAMYQFYQIMICLLKFDFFCFIGVTSQVCYLAVMLGPHSLNN